MPEHRVLTAIENIRRRSTVSILLSTIFALTFICHDVSSLAQTKSSGTYGEKTAFIISRIDSAVTTEFQKAWHLSCIGSDRSEGLVQLFRMEGGSILARAQRKSDEHYRFTFRWVTNIIAVVHTHPFGADPRPSATDCQLADRFGVPMFTITQRGMYVYDPDTKSISMVQKGLDWLNSTKWNNDRQAVAQEP